MPILDLVIIPLTHHADTIAINSNSNSIMGRKLLSLRTRIGGFTTNKSVLIKNKEAFDGLVLELRDLQDRVILKVPMRYILDMTESNGLGLQFPAFVPDWIKSKLYSNNPSVIVTDEVVELLCEVL
jgi:hypothetical protein